MHDVREDFFSGLLVAAVAAAVFVPGLGSYTLIDRDEPRFAEAGRLMYETGDWIVPRFNGEVRYHKPPMLYWLMCAGYAVFGVNETGARSVSAAMAVGSCIVVFLIARSMFTRRAALISGLISATTLLVFIEGRIATADSLLLATVLLMFWGFQRIVIGRNGVGSFLLLYGGLAAGSLTKGPVSASVLIVAVGLYALMRRERPPAARAIDGGRLRRLLRRLRAELAPWRREVRAVAGELHLAAGLAAAAAVTLGWFIPAIVKTDGGFLTEGLLRHVGERAFVRDYEGHGGVPVVFYVILLPLFFFPWFAVLPESLVQMWRSKGRNRRAFLLAWGISPFLVFSFLRTKLPHYVLPAYPAFAIICGAMLDGILDTRRSLWRTPAGKLGLILFGLMGAGAAAGLAALPRSAQLGPVAGAAVAPAVVLLVMTALVLVDFVRGNVLRGSVAMAVLMVGAAVVVSLRMAPALEELYTIKNLALDIREEYAGQHVVCLGLKEHASMVFYLQQDVPFIRRADEVAVGRLDQQAVFTVKPAGSADEIRRSMPLLCIATRKEAGKLAGLGESAREVRRLECFGISQMKWHQLALWEITAPPEPAQ